MNVRLTVLHFLSRRQNIGVWAVSGCWIVGLLLGVYFAFSVDYSSLLMMRGWLLYPVSIVDSLVFCILPLIISAFAVYLNEHWALCPILWARAVGFGFCSCVFCRCFASAGWLISVMGMFSCWISNFGLLYIGMLAFGARNKVIARLPWLALSVLAAILVEMNYIAPILAQAFNQ